MRIIIRAQPKTSARTLNLGPSQITVRERPQRVLDFDIENRPLTYLGSDFTTAEVTAIAWAWADQPETATVYLLGEQDLPQILKSFVAVYSQADLVTGHYVRGHDIPMINGALMEQRMPPLPDKRVQDTKIDLVRSKGLSLSQESLSAMFRLEHQKQSMNQVQWRAANRLTPEGLAEVRRRAVGDVRQHIELRRELLASGYLTPPKMWRGGTAQAEQYTP